MFILIYFSCISIEKTASRETNVYLTEIAYKFPVEAGMSHDVAKKIYQEAYLSVRRERAATEAANWPKLYF
jgi:hypothetical protein